MALDKLIDPDLPRFIDTFAAVLIYHYEETLLPDLIDVFGPKMLPKFLDVFAGTTFEVPTRRKIEEVVRNVSIYLSIKEGRLTIDEAARKHDLTRGMIRLIFGQVRKISEGANL